MIFHCLWDNHTPLLSSPLLPTSSFLPSSFCMLSVLLWTNPDPRAGVLPQIPAQWEQVWCFSQPGLAIGTLHHPQHGPPFYSLLGSTRCWTFATAFQLTPCYVVPTTHDCTVVKVIFAKHRNHPIRALLTLVSGFPFLTNEYPICCLPQVCPRTWSFVSKVQAISSPFCNLHNKCRQNWTVSPWMFNSACLLVPFLAKTTLGSVLVPFYSSLHRRILGPVSSPPVGSLLFWRYDCITSI